MKGYEAAGIGIIMGCLYGIVLWASVDTFSLISFLNFGDPFYIPFRVTSAVTLTAFLCLFTVPGWYPFAERLILELGEVIAEAREIDEDDDD